MKKMFYLKKVKRKKGLVYLFRLNKESGVVGEDEHTFHSTYQSSRPGAEAYVYELIESRKDTKCVTVSEMTLREYADPFFVWETCPYVKRVQHNGASITNRYVENQRGLVENHIFSDPICQRKVVEIRRAEIIDLRERLLERTGTFHPLAP